MARKVIVAMLASGLILAGCGHGVHAVVFDGGQELSGAKISLKDINPGLPSNWEGYGYVVLEFRISTAQRFQVGFTTDSGYNELRVMSYVPNAWNRLAIPLKFFTEPPAPATDLAATNNHPRSTGWINLGGERFPMRGVDSIGFRMRRAIGKPVLEIRDVTLSVDDPGDEYLEGRPAFDSLGQSNLVDYPAKVRSLDELRGHWAEEDAETIDGEAYGYSHYGGYSQRDVGGTGFFRAEKVDGRWWFVDPEGHLFLSVGVDCVNIFPNGAVRDYDKRPNLFSSIPPAGLMARMGDARACSFGMWNVYRRYGDDYKEKALDRTIKRMDKWGFNTVANWSADIVKRSGRKAFLHQLHDMGFQDELMGLCDVYDGDFESDLEASIREQTGAFAENPWLIGYFLGNEPAWLNQEDRLCGLILSGGPRPIKEALEAWLDGHGDTKRSRKEFVYDAFRKYLEVSDRLLRKYDPNHLNLGMRFGDPLDLPDEVLEMCAVFDVFSFNCYDLFPRNEVMDKVSHLTGRPMMIGEYHFGTVDRGYAQSLWQVESEAQRGVAYRYYTELAYSHPSLIGTGYFQWADQDISGRFDGENYNCGLVDVTDRPYREFVEAVMLTSSALYDIHRGARIPFGEVPVNCRGHEVLPVEPFLL